MANVAINVYGTTNALGFFATQTQGFVEGMALDDPAANMWLNTGLLASTETLVMVGGVPIVEQTNFAGFYSDNRGPAISRATATNAPTGISVINLAYHMVITPGNNVPQVGSLDAVHFYRFGSNARVPMQISAALLALLGGAPAASNQLPPLYWDPVNFNLTSVATNNIAMPTGLGILSVNENSKIIQWSNGLASWGTGPVAVINLA